MELYIGIGGAGCLALRNAKISKRMGAQIFINDFAVSKTIDKEIIVPKLYQLHERINLANLKSYTIPEELVELIKSNSKITAICGLGGRMGSLFTLALMYYCRLTGYTDNVKFIVTTPFRFEGKMPNSLATLVIQKHSPYFNLKVVNQQECLADCKMDINSKEAFEYADKALSKAIFEETGRGN